MSTDRKRLQFDEFMHEASTIFDEVEASGEEIVVERHGKLFSIRPKRTSKQRSRKQFGPDDSLFRLIGIGSSGSQDVSTQKHKYLADAIVDVHNGSRG